MKSRLKQVRIEKGMNQEEFANLLGYRSNYYSWFETGRREINESILYRLTKIGINTDWILTGEGSMYGEKETSRRKIAEEYLLAEFLALPPSAQDKIIDFAKTLLTRSQAEQKARYEKNFDQPDGPEDQSIASTDNPPFISSAG